MVIPVRSSRPLPKLALASVFIISLAYLQMSAPSAQLRGYWPGVDVSAAHRVLVLGVGIAGVAAWTAQRWSLWRRMDIACRSGWRIAARDITQLYMVVAAGFAADYALLIGYRLTGEGGGFPKLAVFVDGMVWLLFVITVGWAIGSVLRKAAAVFTAIAVSLLLSVASVMANDGHMGYPLLAGRQLPTSPSYAVEWSPVLKVTAAGIVTTILVSALIVVALSWRRSWSTIGVALAGVVLIPVASSLATGGNSWLQPRSAATNPVCVGEKIQVCSWQEDKQRLAGLAPKLSKLAIATDKTGYMLPGRLSVSGAITNADAKICPFRNPADGVYAVLENVPLQSEACSAARWHDQCEGDSGQRKGILALSQIYHFWLLNFSLDNERLVFYNDVNVPSGEYRAAERALGWSDAEQFSYMAAVYVTVAECRHASVSQLLVEIGYRS